jgi:hypothetical protein
VDGGSMYEWFKETIKESIFAFGLSLVFMLAVVILSSIHEISYERTGVNFILVLLAISKTNKWFKRRAMSK